MLAGETRTQAPDHVPRCLVWDREYRSFLQEAGDPFEAGCRLHAGPDIVWATGMHRGQQGWLITRHALMNEILLDYQRFSAERADLNELLGSNIRFLPLDCDPPVHHRYRQTLAPSLTPAAVKRFEDTIRGICAELTSALKTREECDFIADFASVFPSHVFLALVGMPRDMLPQFLSWNDDFVRGIGEVRLNSARSILAYLQNFLIEQRDNRHRTAMMDAILGHRDGLESLDDNEALGMTYMLYVAGLDTVYSTTGWLVKHLASDRGLQQRLRESPADIPRAIDELTRAYSVSTTTRRVVSDCDFHGVAMRANDEIIMPLFLATRDPVLFEDPHKIDIDRRPRHLTFGSGAHICLGFHLAKRELVMVFEYLLNAFSDISIETGWEFHTDGPVLGLDKLPLRLTPAEKNKVERG